MIAGFSGHLVSEQFLEQQIAHLPQPNQRHSFDAGPRMCRERLQRFGPTSSVRVLLECGAAPIASEFGFPVVADVSLLEHAAMASLRTDHTVVALVVTRWGERLDTWWRPAIVEG